MPENLLVYLSKLLKKKSMDIFLTFFKQFTNPDYTFLCIFAREHLSNVLIMNTSCLFIYPTSLV